MIDMAILFKIALITAGSDDAAVCDIDGSDRFTIFTKWFADADVVGLVIGFLTECQYISTQIDKSLTGTVGIEIFTHTVCGITFGDAAEIQCCIRISQSDRIAVYCDLAIVNRCECCIDLRLCRNRTIVIGNIPQIGQCADASRAAAMIPSARCEGTFW